MKKHKFRKSDDRSLGRCLLMSSGEGILQVPLAGSQPPTIAYNVTY